MTGRERFVRNCMIVASVAVGAFVALAAAEGLLVVGIVVFVVMVLSFAAVSFWLWTGERRGEIAPEGIPADSPNTQSSRLTPIAGGLLNVGLAIATIALMVADKSGLATLTGLVAVATATALARWSYRARRNKDA
jgi:hypothetical protein